MGYYEQTEQLKSILKNYSEKEGRLTELYNMALENAEKAKKVATEERNRQYYLDRNQAASDNAQQLREVENMLAARGLGFSGEAVQAKLNANMDLSNRLGVLSREKQRAEQEGDISYANQQLEINRDYADRLKDLLGEESKINLDLAQMELDREQGEANRLAQKENNEANRLADKEKSEADRLFEKEQSEADRQLKLYMQAKELAQEKEALQLKLEAEKNAAANKGNGKDGDDEEEEVGYTPEISAKELAQKLISASGGAGKKDLKQEYSINKFLLTIKNGYDLNPDYYNELLFVLKAYGYEDTSEPMMRAIVAGYESKNLYYDIYDKTREEMLGRGFDEANAEKAAKQNALQQQLEYIHENVNNLSEFKLSCRKIGVSSSDMEKYIKDYKESQGKDYIGSHSYNIADGN